MSAIQRKKLTFSYFQCAYECYKHTLILSTWYLIGTLVSFFRKSDLSTLFPASLHSDCKDLLSSASGPPVIIKNLNKHLYIIVYRVHVSTCMHNNMLNVDYMEAEERFCYVNWVTSYCHTFLEIFIFLMHPLNTSSSASARSLSIGGSCFG